MNTTHAQQATSPSQDRDNYRRSTRNPTTATRGVFEGGLFEFFVSVQRFDLARQVYTQFLKYIYAHAAAFFREQTPDGDRVWNRVKDSVEIVLAIPNGWDGKQVMTRSWSLARRLNVVEARIPPGCCRWCRHPSPWTRSESRAIRRRSRGVRPLWPAPHRRPTLAENRDDILRNRRRRFHG